MTDLLLLYYYLHPRIVSTVDGNSFRRRKRKNTNRVGWGDTLL
jgi:hypothetical protein